MTQQAPAWLLTAGVALAAAAGVPAYAQTTTAGQVDPTHTAPVEVDGKVLFHLRGTSAFSAEDRARHVRDNILAVARNKAISPADLTVVEGEDESTILAGTTQVMRIFDPDAQIEEVKRPLLAQIYHQKVVDTITAYREARSTRTLLRNALFALGVTAATVLLVWGARTLFRLLNKWAERHIRRSVEQLEDKSFELIRAGPLWSLIRGLLGLVRTIVYVALAYFYLNTVLGLFPWTNPLARVLFELVLYPLESLWKGFLQALPSLLFLVVLWFVVKYLLQLIRAFFRGVASGRIRIENFEADWAEPTYKIVRVLVVAFALVIAYPYIPGSDSAAFKGVSVFLGILLSLGSSSFVANMIAGLSMTYRRAFRVGDLIKIGDTIGQVEEIKLMITRLRTAKSESVILPNSNVLNTEIVNYTQQQHTKGLILHSTVGIGYDAPWRQVEAMLIEAADRSPGLKKDPPPFVLQTELGDYAVNYQINAYWDGKAGLLAVRSNLLANIQDIFNEHGVQIMSPRYVSDPATPKVVPPDKWYEAPAKKP